MTKLPVLLRDFNQALHNLDEALRQKKDDFMRDSAIKRFELLFDLGWKALKAFLEEQHTILCNSPRACLKEAFSVGVIPYDDFWLEILSLRNDAVHAYSESLAEKIYRELPQVAVYYQKLYDSLSREVEKG